MSTAVIVVAVIALLAGLAIGTIIGKNTAKKHAPKDSVEIVDAHNSVPVERVDLTGE